MELPDLWELGLREPEYLFFDLGFLLKPEVFGGVVFSIKVMYLS